MQSKNSKLSDEGENWYLQFCTKYLEQTKEMKEIWIGAENFDNCFCKSFNLYN